jgi:K+-sensing histidine kinase KdpD
MGLDTNVTFAEKLVLLGELSSLVNVAMKENELLALFTSKLHILFEAKALAIWIYDKKKRTVSLKYGHDLVPKLRECCSESVPIERFPEVNLSVDRGAVWTTEDLNDTPLYADLDVKEMMLDAGIKAVMGVPLRAFTKVLGAISIYFAEPRSFGSDERAIALAFANALALSLVNVESYEKLVASEKIKGEVIDIVAHQFRTPIATLRGNVELLKDESISGDPKTRGEIINELEKVGEKLKMFVESFLNVKAIDEGNLNPKPRNIKINELVEQVVMDMKVFSDKHKVGVELKKMDKDLEIFVDPTLITEAITNIINNAIKYAEKQVDIDMSYDASEVTIAVKDDGVGIPKKDQSMIFQKLFRATNVMRHPEASSGLGLYIAKQYVEKNNGRIWFESDGEGHGSTFFLVFSFIN